MAWPTSPQRIAPPTRRDRVEIRALIVVTLATLTGFVAWLLQPRHVGDWYLFWPLTIALGLTIVGWLFEWWYYWRIDTPAHREPALPYTVDIFTTACPGEPRQMILRTLLAMQKITYPHTSYLCDEGDDPILRNACERLGVVHVTRSEKKDAKAGNINNALRKSNGEICVILDPDHEPAPYLIDRILGHFDDPEVGFVQTIQPYRNLKASLIARGAGEMSYHFYGPIQMGMHEAGTPQAIGANCVFRRTALESIGGHSPGLAEDMHTAMCLFGKGWKGLYVPEALTRGLVPQTLGAFYKQQLKWSCGVLDLLFRVYPRLFKSFTWQQRLHFLLAPVYFLRGLVVSVSIAVPIICLITGGVAWKIAMGQLLLWALPVLALVTLVRQASQRFLLEPSEHGFHLLGGLLSVGTWWVFLLGNLCALFRWRVPYLPTPKDDRPEDAWRLATPNIAIAGLCAFAIVYGLRRDFSPYSVTMAAFAGWNALNLLFFALLGQQRTMAAARRMTRQSLPAIYGALRRAWATARSGEVVHRGLLGVARHHTAVLTVLVLLVAGGVMSLTSGDRTGRSFTEAWAHLVKEKKEYGGFYTGIYLPREHHELASLPAEVKAIGRNIGAPLDIVSMYVAWGPHSLDAFPEQALRTIHRNGGVPMITWEPWAQTFPWAGKSPDLAQERRVLDAIARGAFDYYIRAYADRLRDLGGPVFQRFAHEMDNPQYPWSHAGGNTPEDFVAAWRQVVRLFNERGAANVAWVWNPWSIEQIDRYFPGEAYVDWIGVTLLNYGQAGRDARWHSFSALYEPYQHALKDFNKPIMIAELGSTPYGGDQAAWLREALSDMTDRYTQIRAAVLFHSDRDENWATDWRPWPGAVGIDWTALQHPEAARAVADAFNALTPSPRRQALERIEALYDGTQTDPMPQSASIGGSPGSFELMVGERPFYVRGIAYNPGHDWRDGGTVLTRRQLEDDFERIRNMGANTIRRYTGGWYDRNIFNVAAEKDLKVIYGLWLPQDLNYLSDDDVLAKIEREFVKLVRKHRDAPALLAWSIGNESWGMLKHSYGQPYLTDLRKAYVVFIERLARRIKELDPNHPVIVACEHSDQLSGAVADFITYAPSVDIIGINSYYEPHLAHLPDLMRQFAPDRPYLVTEFGPDGYWHPQHTPRDAAGELDEPSGRAKAKMYARRWQQHIQADRGQNLGGVAYSWADRYEGSATWFGLTDFEGRPKPAYFALREVWTGQDAGAGPVIQSLSASHTRARPGQTIELQADITLSDDGGFTACDWSVLDTRYRVADARIRSDPVAPGRARITLPNRTGRYRVHLTVVDRRGRIDQRSIPILVQEDLASSGALAYRQPHSNNLGRLRLPAGTFLKATMPRP